MGGKRDRGVRVGWRCSHLTGRPQSSPVGHLWPRRLRTRSNGVASIRIFSRRILMSNSVAIITGASQGIGRASAIRLARDFSALVLVARNRAHLDETAEAVKAGAADALVIDVDLGLP